MDPAVAMLQNWCVGMENADAAFAATGLQRLYGVFVGNPALALPLVLTTVSTVMQAHAGNADVQWSGSAALYYLMYYSHGSPAEAAEAFIAVNLHGRLLAAMAAHPTSVDVQLYACLAVERMAIASVRARAALKEAGAVEACTRAVILVPNQAKAALVALRE